MFGRFYELLATTLLFTTDAYLILVNGFFRSFDVIPAGGLSISTISSLLTKNMGEFLVAAIEIAGPILACLFLAEITLGLLARAAPNLNVFALAFPLRVDHRVDRRRESRSRSSRPRSATSCATRSRRSGH